MIVTIEKSQIFSQLSGDWNPMHIDPVAARRVQFGQTVIHGVHGTLAALNEVFSDHFFHDKQLSNISASYMSPIYQGQQIGIRTKQAGDCKIRIFLEAGGKTCQVIKIELSPSKKPLTTLSDCIYGKDEPKSIRFSEAKNLNGRFNCPWEHCTSAELFPTLTENLPDWQIASMLSLTYLVGMICPGTHSIFTGFYLDLHSTENFDTLPVNYNVSSTDERFNKVKVDISSDNCFSGSIEAIFRPENVQQSSCKDISNLNESSDFSALKVLILGGSRGLGEVTAKIYAMRGAKVHITYSNGRAEAETIKKDIVDNGGICDISQLDVTDDKTECLEIISKERFDYIYYFCSPHIGINNDGFDNKKFLQFIDFYVIGLSKVLTTLSQNGYDKNKLKVIIPSTVFIDKNEKGFSEYIVAKLAAEAYLEQACLKYDNWSCYKPRLPAMLTDQTAGATTANATFTLSSLIKIIDEISSQP